MYLRLAVLCPSLLLATAAWADISGRVLDGTDATPIAGAEVRLQADENSPVVITDANGNFTLPVNPSNQVNVAAAVPYDPDSSANYTSNINFAVNGQTNVEIGLRPLPVADNPNYQPPTSFLCSACHGEQHAEWSTARHAGAGVNPWVLDLHSGGGTPGGSNGYVFRDTHDAGETGFCATCHTALEDVFDPGNVQLDEVLSASALEGVSCLVCHQIGGVDENNINGLHHFGGKTQYRFPAEVEQNTEFQVFGPLADVEAGIMYNVYNPLFSSSRLCAACHQYNNPDTGAPGQNTYNEWLASPFAQPGPEFRTCQNCHMPQADEPGPITTIGSVTRPASQRHSHEFIGATPETLSAAITLTVDAEQQGDEIVVTASVFNSTGHSFPTGVSIRNAMLSIDVRADGQLLAQTDGPQIPFYGSDDVPGTQPGDLAGTPGKGFAKVLQGRINGQGAPVEPVLFIDAETTLLDTLIPSVSTDTSTYRFAVPAGFSGNVSVDTRLLYRRAWRALAVTKGWTITPGGMPVEIEVASEQRSIAVESRFNLTEIPSLGLPALLILALVLGLLAWRRWQ